MAPSRCRPIPATPTDAYTLFFCQGIHKTSDYGRTWTGPINTGRNAARLTDCAGTISVVPTGPKTAPTLYATCIRGTGTGLWKSVNGGVDWTQQAVAPAPSGSGQQFNSPVADPYDSQHLLMAGHAINLLVESTNGGSTWSRVTTSPGMAVKGGTGGIQFVNTGKATTTRTTWLWLGPQTGGAVGTWRTVNAGAKWTKVDKNEHVNSETQIYQPDTSGVMFMAGVYSDLGWGVLKSTNFGQTWTHAGPVQAEGIVFGTANAVYAMYGWAAGPRQVVAPRLATAAPSGTSPWISPATPAAMSQGPAQAAVLNDGTSNVVLTANYNAGLWRYVESTGATSPTTTVRLSASVTSVTAAATQPSPGPRATPHHAPRRADGRAQRRRAAPSSYRR